MPEITEMLYEILCDTPDEIEDEYTAPEEFDGELELTTEEKYC